MVGRLPDLRYFSFLLVEYIWPLNNRKTEMFLDGWTSASLSVHRTVHMASIA